MVFELESDEHLLSIVEQISLNYNVRIQVQQNFDLLPVGVKQHNESVETLQVALRGFTLNQHTDGHAVEEIVPQDHSLVALLQTLHQHVTLILFVLAGHVFEFPDEPVRPLQHPLLPASFLDEVTLDMVAHALTADRHNVDEAADGFEQQADGTLARADDAPLKPVFLETVQRHLDCPLDARVDRLDEPFDSYEHAFPRGFGAVAVFLLFSFFDVVVVSRGETELVRQTSSDFAGESADCPYTRLYEFFASGELVFVVDETGVASEEFLHDIVGVAEHVNGSDNVEHLAHQFLALGAAHALHQLAACPQEVVEALGTQADVGVLDVRELRANRA